MHKINVLRKTKIIHFRSSWEFRYIFAAEQRLFLKSWECWEKVEEVKSWEERLLYKSDNKQKTMKQMTWTQVWMFLLLASGFDNGRFRFNYTHLRTYTTMQLRVDFTIDFTNVWGFGRLKKTLLSQNKGNETFEQLICGF